MSKFILNNKSFSAEQLTDTDILCNQAGLSDYENRVLQFCRRWLSGQETFTVHTSGSTGKPKAIPITREQMVTSAHLTGDALGLQPGDRSLVCLSVDYIAGMMMVVRGFVLGLHVTIVDPISNPLAQFPPEVAFDFTALVPLQMQEMLSDGAGEAARLNNLNRLNKMKGILIGGALVSLTLQTQLQAITTPIYHTYGMTETVTHIALKRLNGPQKSDYFFPLTGVELGLDGRGCLAITAPVTQGNPVQTNDLVDLRPDGSFIWLGRIDNVINTGGVKVQVEKVEMALEKFLHQYRGGQFATRRFFVGPLNHPRLGQTVVAVIEGTPFSENGEHRKKSWLDIEVKIRQDLQNSLTKYEIPRKFYFVDHLLETPTGKIDRAANLARLDPAR